MVGGHVPPHPGYEADTRPPGLLVTCNDIRDGWKARLAVRRTIPGSWVTYTPFRGVLLVETEGDPLTLASRLAGSRGPAIARVAAVLAQVPSTREEMLEAVREAGNSQIGPAETFAVRVHKRGVHGYTDPAPALERDAGAVIWQVCQDRDGTPPRVNLEHPDVTIHVEVLGPRSLICIVRRTWASSATPADNAPS